MSTLGEKNQIVFYQTFKKCYPGKNHLLEVKLLKYSYNGVRNVFNTGVPSISQDVKGILKHAIYHWKAL